MTFSRCNFKALMLTLLATSATFALVSCAQPDSSVSDPSRPPQLTGDHRMSESKGLKDGAYLDKELTESIARLHGMGETLGRLQSDLQGTTIAMQRVEMMRREVDTLNSKMEALQARLGSVGREMVELQPPLATQTTTETTTTTQTTEVAPAGSMLAPVSAKQMEAAEKAGALLPEEMGASPVVAPAMAPDANGPTPLLPTATPTQKANAAPAVITPKVEAPKKVTAPKGDGVVGVRFGEHNGSTRIVLDAYAKSNKFTATVDNTDKVLTIELPETPWSAAKAETLKNNPLVASYTAQPSGKGSIVAIALKGEAKITSSSAIAGVAGKPARIVVDIAKP